MKTARTFRQIPVILLTAALAHTAIAEEGENKFYLTPEIGQIQVRKHCDEARAAGATSCDEKETVFGLTGGYNFHDNFSAETALHYASGFDVQGASTTASSDFLNISLGGRVQYPFLDGNMFFTGRAGIHNWQFNTDISDGSSNNEDGTNAYFGGGIAISRYDRISILLEYTRYVADNDADLFTLGAKLDL